MFRILVCDDHALIRDLLCAHLRETVHDSNIFEAHDYSDICVKTNIYGPFDLMILDYRMPGWYGVSGIRKLLTEHPETRVLLFSGLISADELEAARDLGIAGYLPKSFDARTLVKAVRKLLEGGLYFPPIAGAIAHSLYVGSGPPALDLPARQKFTERQVEILGRLVQGQTNKQIGVALEIAENTVKDHVKNIIDILGARNRTQAAAIAGRMNWF